jgi:hypothetical protein
MSIQSDVHSGTHSGIQNGEDAALVQAAKEGSSNIGTLMEQASDRIRRSQGKLFVTLVLMEQARKASLSQRMHESARVRQAR